MRILQVDLDNVKSYRQVSVPFTIGTNAICGQNGAGKSTLLEAIGFALFDFLAVKQDGFVREGEKTATVTVHVADTDGRAYQVVRRCGGSNQYYVYDPELDQKITDGKVETVMWLREFLGVEPTTDLTVLFRDAVGVPQGLLTAAFLETASRRKDVFNPLLRVDEYERVWGTLRESRRWLEHLIADMGKQIVGLEAELRVLPNLRVQLADLTDQIIILTQQKTEAQAEINKVMMRKTEMEILKTQLDTIEQELSQAVAGLQTLSVQRKDAQDALERAKAAQAVVLETADAHQAYLDVEERLNSLEEQRIARDQAQQAQQECIHAQELAQQELAHLEQSLITIADAEQEMVSLLPQVETQARLEAAIDDIRRAVERLKIAKETHAREHRRLMEMEARLETVRSQLDTRAVLETELQSAQIELENRNTQRDNLMMELSENEKEYQTACQQTEFALRSLQEKKQDLERAQQRQIELEEKQREINSDLEILTKVETQMEKVRADIATLVEQNQQLIAQLAAAQTEQESLHSQITVLSMAETAVCPVCGGPLSSEHREELLARNRARVADLDAVITEIQTKQYETENDQNQKEMLLRQLGRQVQNLPRPTDAQDIEVQISAHKRNLTEKQTEVAEIQSEVTTLEKLQTTLKTTLDEVRSFLDEVTSERYAAQITVSELEGHLKELPRFAEADDLVTQIDKQRQVVTEREKDVVDLRDAPDEMERLEEEKAALGDPRRAYQRAADIAAQRETITVQHTNTMAKLTELNAQRVILDAEVAAYVDLDANITDARAEREVYGPDHLRYLQHEREAETLVDRQSALDALNVELHSAEVYKDEKITARDEVDRQYDRELYADLVTQHGMLREELAGLEASLRLQQAQLRTMQETITHLDARQLELDTKQIEQEELTEVQALLEYLRQVLRDAGPEVTRALVGLISLQADQLYTDIMQSYGGRNPTARLRWTEDYDIVLTSLGRDRIFQQLSGGEQMVAALAVRLALLREVSTVDVAFFDEPTANLDQDRRANLAQQVLNIQGFGQLFVISHDDTFEQDTDYVVHIEKTDGESRVVV